MTTDRQNIDATDHITRGRQSARPTAVYSSVLVPCATNRAILGRIVFICLNSATGFIVEVGNQYGITGTADLLGLAPSHLLGCVVKGFSNIARGPWKSRNDFARGFMHQVTQAPVTLCQHSGFASLQPLPLSGAFRLAALRLATRSKPFVAVLHRGFSSTPTDKQSFLPIGGRQQGIHPQIDTNHRLLRHRDVFNLAHQPQGSHTQSHLHQASREGHRDRNTQATTCPMRQEQMIITETRILIRIHHITIARLFPWVRGFWMAVLAQLARTVHGFTELAKDLLHTLRTQPRIPALGPMFPSGFAGPFQVATAHTVMTLDQITPQARGFLPRTRKGAPLGRGARKPMNFYRAVAHTMNIAHLCNITRQKRSEDHGRNSYIPRVNLLGSTSWGL